MSENAARTQPWKRIARTRVRHANNKKGVLVVKRWWIAVCALASVAAHADGLQPEVPISGPLAVTAMVESLYATRVQEDLLRKARDATEGAPYRPGLFHCLATVSHASVGAALAPVAMQNLTAEEIATVTTFIASATGEKFRWVRGPWQARAAAPNVAPLSQTDLDTLRAFADSTVGTKLTIVPSLPALVTAIGDFEERTLARCMALPVGPLSERRNATLAEAGCTPPLPVRYPASARRSQQSGRVDVAFWVDKQGALETTAVVRSSRVEALDREAERAVRGMRCKVLEIQGVPTSFTAIQPIQFELK